MPDLTIQPLQTGSIKQLAVADNGDGTRSLRITDTPGDEVSTIRLRQSGGMKQETGSHLLGDDCILCLPLRTNATDVGPNGFSVTNHGVVTFDAGDGASFNGTDQWLSIANDALLNPAGSFTMAAFVNATAADPSAYLGIISKIVYSDYTTGYGLFMGDNNDDPAHYDFATEFLVDGGENAYSTNNQAITLDELAHFFYYGERNQVVVTYDIERGVSEFYINGILIASGTDPLTPVLENAANLVFGRWDAGESHAAFFNGYERDVFMASRVWTAGDVLAHYNGGLGQADGGLNVAVEDPDILIDVPQGTIDLTVTRNTGETAWTLLVHTG